MAPRRGKALPGQPASLRGVDLEELVTVGEITRPHGVRGAVRVAPVTDFPDHLLTLDRVVVVQGHAGWAVRVEEAEMAGRFVVVKLTGVETRDAAEALRGATLRISPEEARPLPPGEFYVFQIVGLRVRTPDGQALGRVVEVLRTGSNDVYVVRSSEGREILLPAVDGVVETIDMEAGEVVARPPEWV